MVEIIINDKLLHLRNDHVSYVIGILEGGIPAHLYFGKRVGGLNPAAILRHYDLPVDGSFSMQGCALDHVPHEYPAFGLGDLREGAVSVRQQDGTRSVDLRVTGTEVVDGKSGLPGLPATFGENAKTLLLHMKDELIGLEATLSYTLFDDVAGVMRSVSFRNASEADLVIERAYSLCLELPDSRYDLITLSGAWSREREMIRRPLTMGEQGVSSLKGATSLHNSNMLFLARPETTEAQGEAIGAALVYSGNFTAQVHVDSHRYSRVFLGLNDVDFQWTLKPGETFVTPEAVTVYSDAGLDGMSAQFHRVCAEHLVRGKYAKAPRPILLNNWEATYFGFNEEKLLKIARTAADVGVELFVLDDGWFGKRDNDTTSLGDWFVDTAKLPEGMKHLSDQVHAMGLKFGLWFEPEMISPVSKLYEVHPDWAIRIGGREPIQQRSQLTLDLSREDVQDFVYEAVAQHLREDGIDYVKWDMNRNFSNIGSAKLPAERQKELPHRYMLGLYRVLERLVNDFPEVLFESCSSGGGRFDLGMLHYMPQTWTSDNTDALCRCQIQYSTSLVFPPFAMGSHVSAVPNHQTGRITPIETRGNVAMSGCFGYELDLNTLSAEELEKVRAQIARIKDVRNTLLYGDFHRLLSPYEGNDTAWITVSKDQNEAVFMYTRALAKSFTYPPLVKLRGLAADKVYTVRETGESYTGSELMHLGLSVRLPWGDAASVSLTLKSDAE
ncbi:MAG: alpha-galactosidase [Clostridiales bacterium]|nr:alpha-galactosidase [Clostridiales bacterium]